MNDHERDTHVTRSAVGVLEARGEHLIRSAAGPVGGGGKVSFERARGIERILTSERLGRDAMTSEDIRSAIEAAAKYLTEHPDEAHYRDSAATAIRTDGLRVRVDGPGGDSLTTDMPTSVGGSGRGP